ncbi:MAG: tRNA (N6-threonylcarbamoyladenosine(37)-N6)-methyltransferase TrmO [Dehalococcoidia bacterium]
MESVAIYDEIVMRPVGLVHNAARRLRRDGWEEIESRIDLDPALSEALRGLAGFSHVIVLTWLHLAAAEPRDRLSLHPQDNPRLPRIGVFALRVAGRPNPIGCSVVRLVGVEGNSVRVRGLDAIDGTPVLDLKPYLPPYDSMPEAALPDWARPG